MELMELEAYSGLFSGYTELRQQENRNTKIGMLDGNVVSNARTADSGISARVFKQGHWGFASDNIISDASIKRVIKAANGNATFLREKENLTKAFLPKVKTSSHDDFLTSKERKPQKDLIGFVKTIDEHIVKSYPDLVTRSITLGCLDMEKSLITADGSKAYSMIPRSVFYLNMAKEKDGKPISLYGVYGGPGQFEDQFSTPDELYEQMQQQYERLCHKVDGVIPDAGIHECILDADLAGILAHEAIGHTTEADLVLGGSVAADMIDQEAATPLVSLVDFANSALGETCPIPVYTDDEGTPAEDAVIIKDGILKTFMHNKESAEHFGVKPTGNARGYQFSDEPLIRMRNTAILPGKDKLEDMIASVDDGYYLIKSSNGQADSTSEFMFGVVCGYEIKKGKLGRALLNTTISGVAFDMLKTVTMISDEMKWSCSGMCGKKQPIPVGMGGPAIKCRINIGGK